ncbi:MAG: SRPBCC domain-containing protein [Bdellovibrionota bacterium]
MFVINRSFDAPIETVYDMWTKPDHLSRWLPPTGFTMTFHRADIKQGGSTFFSMSNGKGMTMYGRAEYRELRRPSQIVYTQQFCDENERISRHPGAPIWPETMLTTVFFTEEAPERTRVTVVWEPHGAVTTAELNAFIKERGGMTMGWTGSFDKLEELLH